MSKINEYFLFGKVFHQIETFTKVTDKTFTIQIGSNSFFFSNIQLLLISPSIFQTISDTHKPFIITETKNISQNELFFCFNELFFSYQLKNQFLFHQTIVLFINICQIFLIIKNYLPFAHMFLIQMKQKSLCSIL
jgi:hypothetical protein